jgi:hypothetical protein
MDQSNVNVMLFPAVAGLFFFMKRPKIKEIDQVRTEYPVYSRDPSGLSGVARYLNNQEAISLANGKTKELENQGVVHKLSGVARYLKNQEQNPTTGVTKYLLRQAISVNLNEPGNKQSELTSVDKYLKNQKSLPGLSGVAKYLKHQESLPQPSKVAKYMAKQSALASLEVKPVNKDITTGVSKYMQRLESLPQPTKVAKYMAKQAAQAVTNTKHSEDRSITTGVEKYLLQQASQPTISKVAKYMARQALIGKQATVNTGTGVDRYLKHQM